MSKNHSVVASFMQFGAVKPVLHLGAVWVKFDIKSSAYGGFGRFEIFAIIVEGKAVRFI